MTELSKPEGWGTWLDVGPDVAITVPVEVVLDGMTIMRSWLSHKRPDGRNDALSRVEFSRGHHELVSLDPLTISPSLLCPDSGCGFHGYIRDGKWVPA